MPTNQSSRLLLAKHIHNQTLVTHVYHQPAPVQIVQRMQIGIRLSYRIDIHQRALRAKYNQIRLFPAKGQHTAAVAAHLKCPQQVQTPEEAGGNKDSIVGYTPNAGYRGRQKGSDYSEVGVHHIPGALTSLI